MVAHLLKLLRQISLRCLYETGIQGRRGFVRLGGDHSPETRQFFEVGLGKTRKKKGDGVQDHVFGSAL